MKHAIRRLQEELLALAEAAKLVEGDPTAHCGGLGAANAHLAEIARESEEVREALHVLTFAMSRRAAPAAETRTVRTPRGRRLVQADQVGVLHA